MKLIYTAYYFLNTYDYGFLPSSMCFGAYMHQIFPAFLAIEGNIDTKERHQTLFLYDIEERLGNCQAVSAVKLMYEDILTQKVSAMRTLISSLCAKTLAPEANILVLLYPNERLTQAQLQSQKKSKNRLQGLASRRGSP
jgi:hypothetical protein